MTVDPTLVVVAVIAATPPTLAVFFSHRSIHAIVNSRLDAALEKIAALEATVRQLSGE